MEAEDDVHVDHVPCPLSAAINSELQLLRKRHRGQPECYRLSTARLAMAPREPTTTLVHFWFRTRYVSASACQISHLHSHVLGLRICPSTMARFFTSASQLLPAFIRSWVQAIFPEWFLPDRAVLKIQKPGEDQEIMDEYFDTEIKAYRWLKPLQGVIIPKFYGLLRYNGTRAMLLEYLRGVSLYSPEAGTMTLEELSSLLQPCYRAIDAFGVHQDDANLLNFQLVEGKIKVLDLESVVFLYSADQREFFIVSSIHHLASQYLSMRAHYSFPHRRYLEAAA